MIWKDYILQDRSPNKHGYTSILALNCCSKKGTLMARQKYHISSPKVELQGDLELIFNLGLKNF